MQVLVVQLEKTAPLEDDKSPIAIVSWLRSWMIIEEAPVETASSHVWRNQLQNLLAM